MSMRNLLQKGSEPARPAPALTSTWRLGRPERIDDLLHKRCMASEFLIAGRENARRPDHGRGRGGRGAGLHLNRFGDEAEADLAPAGQLDIDLGKQLRVEQRPVQRAVAAIDAVAAAERIEAVLGPGMAGTCKDDGVDHPIQADRRTTTADKLAIDEAEIETGIVRDQRAIAEKLEQGVDAVREQRLVRQESIAQPVDRLG